MKLAICNEIFEGWSWERICRCVRELGYTGLEVAPFTLWQEGKLPGAKTRQSLARAAAAEQLEIVALHWLLARTEGLHLTSPDAATRRRTTQYLIELAEFLAELGGRVLVLGSPSQRRLENGMSRSEGLRFATEIVELLLPTLERHNVVLALEPLAPEECNFLYSAQDAVSWLETLRSPHVRLHLDVKAMAGEKIPAPELIRTHGRLLAHFHANDPNRRGPGMGDYDFLPVLRALQQIQYTGWISVEPFDLREGAEVTARKSSTYLRGCWEQLMSLERTHSNRTGTGSSIDRDEPSSSD